LLPLLYVIDRDGAKNSPTATVNIEQNDNGAYEMSIIVAQFSHKICRRFDLYQSGALGAVAGPTGSIAEEKR